MRPLLCPNLYKSSYRHNNKMQNTKKWWTLFQEAMTLGKNGSSWRKISGMTAPKITRFWKGQEELLCRICETILLHAGADYCRNTAGYCRNTASHIGFHNSRRMLTKWIKFGEAPREWLRIKYAFSSEIQGFQSTELIGLNTNYMNSVSEYLHEKSDNGWLQSTR